MQTGYTFGVEDLNLETGSRDFLVGADIRRSRYKTLEQTWQLQVHPLPGCWDTTRRFSQRGGALQPSCLGDGSFLREELTPVAVRG